LVEQGILQVHAVCLERNSELKFSGIAYYIHSKEAGFMARIHWKKIIPVKLFQPNKL
jgi:hypothetical protein